MKRMLSVLLLAFGVIALLYGAFSLLLIREENIDSERRIYTADPNDLIDQLSKGNSDSLILKQEQSGVGLRESVQWSIEDFLLLAETLHYRMWDESSANWQFSAVSFDYDCQNLSSGPNAAFIQWYRLEKRGLIFKTRYTSSIDLFPLAEEYVIVRSEINPNLTRYKGFRLEDLNISPESALEIAESNGGNEFRQTVQYSCQVVVRYLPNSKNYLDAWEVIYSGEEAKTLYIKINPTTGLLEE